MKVRDKFVSNSSSSSFIIAVDSTKLNGCPVCGRHDISIVELIQQFSDHDYDDDTKYCGNKDFVLRELELGLAEENTLLDGLGRSNPGEITYSYPGSTEKVCDSIDFSLQSISQIKSLIEKVKNSSEVHKVSISYHNQILNDLLRQQIHSGSIRILNKDY